VRVVFDTNVLYSAFVAKGFCEEVLDEAAGECITVWSDPLKRELESILMRRYKIGPATQATLTAYSDLCEFVEPQPLCVCRDNDDDIVLATALTGKADVIVNGDDDLLGHKKFRGTKIPSPRQFLKIFDQG
jgi:uncharacterized protein